MSPHIACGRQSSWPSSRFSRGRGNSPDPHTGSVTLAYVLRRIGVFFLVVFLAVSINFIIPRLRSTNPVEARMNEFAQQGGGNAANIKQLIAIYNEKFGLDKPLWE